MKIFKVTDQEFRKYGRIISGFSIAGISIEMMRTPLPEDVVYEPSVPELEALPVYETLKTELYGELPIQIGYCNGNNYLLNALEYHRSSEVNIAVTDLILILGMQQDIQDDFTYETAKAEAFFVPKGTVIEVYATTLHYAPCNAEEEGFRCVVVLPKDTNLPLKEGHKTEGEDKLLTARNKWLIAHPESGLEGEAFMGLVGENLDVRKY